MKNKKIVLCGGGTAGHVMPNIALVPSLVENGFEVHYIGGEGIEKEICKEHKEIIYHKICAEKLRRNLSLKNLLIPFKVLKGYFQAKKILKKVKPVVVFSKGGFIAVPAVFAAASLKIPVISHESDLTLGLANKLIYKKCKKMFCSFKDTTSYGKKCVHSGSIIRKEILSAKPETNFNLNKTKKTLLIMGGSLGANLINNTVFSISGNLVKNFNVIHICGKGKTNNAIKLTDYNQIEFTSKIENIIAASDFVVSRAGSGSIFEFLALKKPMLLIPLSKAASRGDQILNAENFKKCGFARVLKEEELSPKKLESEIMALKNFTFPAHINIKAGNEIVLKEILKYKTNV